MDMLIIILVVAAIILNIVTLLAFSKNKGKTVLEDSDKMDLKNAFSTNINIITEALKNSNDKTGDVLKEKLESMSKSMQTISDNTNANLEQMRRIQSDEFTKIRETLQENLKTLHENNEKKLSEIQNTVDEKLTKTLNERFNDSFTLLIQQLEKVSKTIGEMQNISNDVGNLTKMLSGVKTAGIFGEIQLGSIIEQILAPEQYVQNVVTKEFGREPVEYAIKMPGVDGEEVLMPIDSKFPYTVYNDMQAAYQKNDFVEFETKKKQLKNTVLSMAKDINNKYINPPRTTNFAVMFLPFEGLYAEIVKMGLVETIQQQFNVTIAGPTTIAALLNSLQMGFKTLAIQKKSNEVWNILSAVKTEFTKFEQILTNIQKRLTTTNSDLDELIGKRTRAINRKLREVEVSTEIKSRDFLSVEDLFVDEEKQ